MIRMNLRIAPSLASAPLDRLGQVIADLEKAKVDLIHFDIEDGSFAPLMTLGTKIIGDLRPLTKIPFDVHLMMVNPEWLLPALAKEGANRISVHYEACPYPRRTLRMIAELGATPGLAFNPGTILPDLNYLQPYLSFVILLTTEPEEPDCPFLPEVLEKMRMEKGLPGLEDVEWVIDGGVKPDNLAEVMEAGADTVVVGRFVFKDGAIGANIAQLRNVVE